MVSGDLSENRPASDALMAMIPASMVLLNNPWQALAGNDRLTDFETIALLEVNADGRFNLSALRGLDIDAEPMLLATIFDQRGQVRAITSKETLLHRIGSAIRVDLFSGTGFSAQPDHPQDSAGSQ